MIETDILLNEAKNGSSEAFRILFDQYKPVVFALQQKYFLRDFDSEDWLQEGRIIFFQVLQRYEAERGATLGKFFKLAFCNHILSLLRKQNAMKRRAALLSSSLEALVEKDDSFGIEQADSIPSPLEHLILREGFTYYEVLFSKLERQVMDYYLLGIELSEICAMLKLPEIKVRSAYDRGKRKLSNHLQETTHNY